MNSILPQKLPQNNSHRCKKINKLKKLILKLIAIITQIQIYFIDTPGINLSKCSLENYVKHFAKINELIVLDGEILSMLKNKDEQHQIQKQFLENDQEEVKIAQSLENSQIQQSISFYYIINKFDERNESEDISVKQVSQEIKDFCNSEEVFKISALMALRYNVMNYCTQDAKDKFIGKFFKAQKNTLGFENLEEAEIFCVKKSNRITN